MNFVVILLTICCSISSYNALNINCIVFNESTRSLEKYCEQFNGIVPENCAKDIGIEQIETSLVTRCKIAGCNNETVLETIKKFPNVHVLDISQSGFKSFKWFNLKFDKLKVLNVSRNALSFIPWEIVKQMPEVTEIDLSHNELTNIDAKHVFEEAIKLTKIHLSHNAIRFLNDDAFATLANLEFIDLRSNRFLKIPDFTKNAQLKTIHLEQNPIGSFDCSYTDWNVSAVTVFLDWTNITTFDGNANCHEKRMLVVPKSQHEGVLITADGKYELHCNENSFSNLHHFVAGHNLFENAADLLQCFVQTIRYLDLSGNFIGNINKTTVESFIHLNTLLLSGTMLMDFDVDVLKSQPNLTQLDLSHNNMKIMQNTVSLKNLGNLHALHLAGNQLANVAEVIQHLTPSVERLNLSGNNVGILNSTIFERFTALKHLNLSNTSLSFADTSPFEPFNRLSSLDISHNDLKHQNFTVLLTVLNKLTEFRAANCQLNKSTDVMKLLGSQLETLSLAGNIIGTLNVQTFQPFGKLKHLILSNTSLTHFDSNLLENQTKLMSLDISYNQLQTIDLKHLSGQLKYLNLEGNELVNISNLFAKQFPSLQTLAIAKNQLPCELLKEFKKWDKITFVGDIFNQKHGENCHFNVIYASAAAVLSLLVLVIAGICFCFWKRKSK